MKELFEMYEVKPTYYESVCDSCNHPMCMPATSERDCDPDKTYPQWLYPFISADKAIALEEVINKRFSYLIHTDSNEILCSQDLVSIDCQAEGKTRIEALMNLLKNDDLYYSFTDSEKAQIKEILEG